MNIMFFLSVALICLLMFMAGAIWWLRKRQFLKWTVFGLGLAGFIVGSRILESILHYFVLHPSPSGQIPLMQNKPLLYVLYAIATAAVFEETTRLILFKILKRKRHLNFADALSYGAGHGGAELLLVGGAQMIGLMVIFAMPHALRAGAGYEMVLKSVTATTLILGVFERIVAFAAQLCLSIWVCAGVSNGKLRYYGWALLFHALFDLPAALSQVGFLPLWTVEVLLVLSFVLLVYLTKRFILEKGRLSYGN
ncbi:YhfC family glutamic-type intramembrane protease [Streptococcus massiliensis]|uniref:Predicted membrane protein n=1 Tax=Streptococcus massiliensis TaxID=313439 RepID=A0A380KXX6_9STRE|nr:YhfC family glutamic-type intramembrane protease [Streptococcus massiliensis]SUN76822.1 Predicted membrane protein [Streptococcus massiliensis]